MLLPGTLCDETLWAPMLARDAALAARARPAPLEGRSVAEAIGILSPQLPRRFAVAGFSLGAIVALELARLLPERVAGLCLIAGNGRAVPPGQAPARRDALRAARVEGLANYVREQLWPRYVAAAARDDALMREHVVAMAERAGMERYGDQIEIAINRRDNLSALAGLPQPALIVGGAHDAINPPELQREMADGIPGAELHMVGRAGHFVPLEAPDELATAVANWLRCCSGTGRETSNHQDTK
ncbi:alpha/beta fold hydrolase [Achromobacter sp. NPDC058515]|uniref:alpha/beta fold hydrolase n=1 Tax=Achromobacter sp. NPDC058515 TaxID=3346533 RepID=UPI0036582D2E